MSKPWFNGGMATELLITVNVSTPYVLIGGGRTGLRPQGIRRDYTATVDGVETKNTSKSEIVRILRQRVYRAHGSAVRPRFIFVEAS